jgi:hypothetical protein
MSDFITTAEGLTTTSPPRCCLCLVRAVPLPHAIATLHSGQSNMIVVISGQKLDLMVVIISHKRFDLNINVRSSAHTSWAWRHRWLYSWCYSFNYTIVNCILTLHAISNEKFVNCKVVDLVQYYNFDVNFVSIWHFNHLKFDLRTYIMLWTRKPSQIKKLSTIKF